MTARVQGRPRRTRRFVRSPGDRSRSEATHEAQGAACNAWLAAAVQEAIDDPRASLSHEDVLAGLDADITALVDGAHLRP